MIGQIFSISIAAATSTPSKQGGKRQRSEPSAIEVGDKVEALSVRAPNKTWYRATIEEHRERSVRVVYDIDNTWEVVPLHKIRRIAQPAAHPVALRGLPVVLPVVQPNAQPDAAPAPAPPSAAARSLPSHAAAVQPARASAAAERLREAKALLDEGLLRESDFAAIREAVVRDLQA